jgi:anti-sigma regulatory factor (Ser/Thr protein kinase)
MAKNDEKTKEIQYFIIYNVDDHQADIAKLTAEKFGLSRVAVSNRLRTLVKTGILKAEGRTKARLYTLATLARVTRNLPITPELREENAWLEVVKPQLIGVKDNVLAICAHGFNEMFNNVIDHSESTTAKIEVHRNAAEIMMRVRDYGVGIFNKIQQALKLREPQHAILELTKGKLTTDKEKHTGEGIFFSSRMFDAFIIRSGTLVFDRFREQGDWIAESDDAPIKGTQVTMILATNATHTTQQIFSEYQAEYDEYGFSKTIIPLKLMKYEGEQLISRSQAKRLMAHVDQFKEVILDFQGVTTIGQAFADEVFRIYRRENPTVHVYPAHTTDEVKNMIKRVIAVDDSLHRYLKLQDKSQTSENK